MIEIQAHRITLKLRAHPAGAGADGRPVEGELECEDGSVRVFIGWLGLVNELERVVSGAA